jgi:hypothetical protein
VPAILDSSEPLAARALSPRNQGQVIGGRRVGWFAGLVDVPVTMVWVRLCASTPSLAVDQ